MNESPITSMYEHKLKILHGAMPLHDPFTPSDVPCEAKGAALVTTRTFLPYFPFNSQLSLWLFRALLSVLCNIHDVA